MIGAGLSGIGAACRLSIDQPGKSFAILESRDRSGGTWDLFRYPGIRSDSDMFTLGYRFRPWKEAEAIAGGPSIRDYIRETAREYGVDSSIRYGIKVVRAEWSTPAAQWIVEAVRIATGEVVHFTCGFLLACTGYYSYDDGYSPEFNGVEKFQGRVVHPQHWPEDLECAGKRVVVIGSGATAVTLIPALAAEAVHVTMLQRSPTYVMSLPSHDPFADFVRRVLPDRIAYPVIRWKNALMSTGSFYAFRAAPGLARRLIRSGVKRQLPAGYPVDTHFRPRYDPWDQRLCLDPDGNFFRAISQGSASVVTDTIETFTEGGIRLASGGDLKADIVVTATGLNLLLFGGAQLVVDGDEVVLPEKVTYKGMMLSGVPNFAFTIGYTNASWTLKCDLVSEYVCRLLAHMEATGCDICKPLDPDPSQKTHPILDFKAGYVKRSIDDLPRQGDRIPWRLSENYPRDVRLLRHGPLEDEGIDFAGDAAQVRSKP